jgi:hypothetical protein
MNRRAGRKEFGENSKKLRDVQLPFPVFGGCRVGQFFE